MSARLSLGYIDDQIVSISNSVAIDIATAKSTALGNNNGGYTTLGALYDLYMENNEAGTDLYDEVVAFIGADSLPTDYNTFNKIADRIVELQTQLDQTNADSSYDTFAEISAYLVTHTSSYAALLSGKVKEETFKVGTGNFNANPVTGETTITFSSAFDSNGYRVFIEPKTANGYVGEFYVSSKTTTGFTVVCTGNPTSQSFDWIAILTSGL